MTIARPSIFIGSSVEGLDVAYSLQQSLEFESEPTVWSQGIFLPTHTTLTDLVAEARRTDFALFVFTPDDVRLMRRETASVPRDNVVFELGLFIGALGTERCFFICPRGEASPSLPSDLLGLAPLGYDPSRTDGRLLAALGPAVHTVRTALRTLGKRALPRTSTRDAATAAVKDLTSSFVEQWDTPALLAARDILHAGIPLHVTEDETGEASAALRRVFAFLDSMADSLLAGHVDESIARTAFGTAVAGVWERARLYLAPLNGADEVWNPPPPLAQLYDRWRERG